MLSEASLVISIDLRNSLSLLSLLLASFINFWTN